MRKARVAAPFLMIMLAAASVLAGCAAAAPSPPMRVETLPAPPPAPTPPQAALPQPAEAPPSRVVVSYFHRTIRCETCLRFEALTERALRDEFADELVSGRLVWRVTDFEEPGQESDVAKYDILESSVVVSRFAGEAEVEWKKLDAIWDLVGDDRTFMDYIQREVGAYVRGATYGQ